MRRITLLLMLMVIALLAVSGVAWAVTKTCPPAPQKCTGTPGNDVLSSSPEDNDMFGLAGNDTYTNFAKPKSGTDVISDAAGTDKLVLTNYTQAELPGYCLDANENGNYDSIYIDIPPKDSQGTINNGVVVDSMYNDQSKKCPGDPGPGYIEDIQIGGGGGASLTGLKPR
jgi:hypothetical protein